MGKKKKNNRTEWHDEIYDYCADEFYYYNRKEMAFPEPDLVLNFVDLYLEYAEPVTYDALEIQEPQFKYQAICYADIAEQYFRLYWCGFHAENFSIPHDDVKPEWTWFAKNYALKPLCSEAKPQITNYTDSIKVLKEIFKDTINLTPFERADYYQNKIDGLKKNLKEFDPLNKDQEYGYYYTKNLIHILSDTINLMKFGYPVKNKRKKKAA